MNTQRVQNWRQTQQHIQPQVTEQKKVKVIVRRKNWLTKGEKILYSLVGLLFVVACYYVITFSYQTDQINREVQLLNQNIEQQRTDNENLQYKIDELSQPERIIAIAEKLGLKIQDTKVRRAHLINE